MKKKTNKKIRAQLSYEYIIIIAAILILLIPFFYQLTYSPYSRSSISSVAIKNLDYAVQTIYNLGGGSKIFIPVQTANIHSFNISNHTISASIRSYGDMVSVYTGFNMVANSDVLENLKKVGTVYVEITAVDCDGHICGIAFGKTVVCLSGNEDPVNIDACPESNNVLPHMEPSEHVVLWGNFDSNTEVYIDGGRIPPTQMTLSTELNKILITSGSLGTGVHNVYTRDAGSGGVSPDKRIQVKPEHDDNGGGKGDD